MKEWLVRACKLLEKCSKPLFTLNVIFVVKLRNSFDERKRVFLQKLVGVDLIKSAHVFVAVAMNAQAYASFENKLAANKKMFHELMLLLLLLFFSGMYLEIYG